MDLDQSQNSEMHTSALKFKNHKQFSNAHSKVFVILNICEIILYLKQEMCACIRNTIVNHINLYVDHVYLYIEQELFRCAVCKDHLHIIK